MCEAFRQRGLEGLLNVLAEAEVCRIHEASLALLQGHGMLCESDSVLGIFQRAGARVDESRIIRVPPEMVNEALKCAPRSFTLYGRDRAFDIVLESGHVYFGLGGTPEPYIWDHDLQAPRRPTKADMVSCTRIGHALGEVDFVMALCSAGDMPQDVQYAHEYDALFRNTTKPVIGSAPGRRCAQKYLEMAAIASGGERALRQRPCVVMFSQPVSPFKFGRYSENILQAASLGIPVLSSPGPMMGATSPASLAGMLVQANAEALFGIVLTQLVNPGNPVIYGPHTAVMDMSTGQCTYGSPEQSLARAAVAQLGRFYGLPSFGLGGGVEAKLPDAEAASQAMMGMLLNALSGLTLTQTLGTLASGLYGSMEMAVICDEMARMIRRVTEGVSVDDETLATDVIQEVGHGGHFLETDHTLRLFRREMFFPVLFRRNTIEQWSQAGGVSIAEAAHRRVQEILTCSGPLALPSRVDEALTQALHSV